AFARPRPGQAARTPAPAPIWSRPQRDLRRLTFTLGAPRPAPSPARRRGTLRALRSAQDGGALVQPVTYEEAHAPHHIAHRKGWLSLHTGNLDGEAHAAERTVEDVFLRKFMLGTFPGCLADQIILKRRANQVEICALVLRQLPAHKFYFLVGYSETLLSHFYKCPVRLHLQTVPSKVVYKYL
uniref:Mitochondrial ribosomal protein S24 n=1 Tax=Equus caballus TaxID=9796 RepID=A0A9L0SRL0_HORSE